MHPYPSTQSPTQKRSRADFSSTSVSDCLPSFPQSSETSSTGRDQRNGTNASNIGDIALNHFDEDIYSSQIKKKIKKNSPRALTAGFHTFRSCTQSGQAANLPPTAACPSPDDLHSLELQFLSQLNPLSSVAERHLEKASSAIVSFDALPSGTFEPFEPLSYLDTPYGVLDSIHSSCNRQVPLQPFVISPDTYDGGSLNSNIRKHALSLRHLVPPGSFCSSDESSGSNGSIVPQGATSAFYPTLDSMLCKKNNSKDSNRFKPFHEEKWNEHLEQLRAFKNKFGHCLVPHTFPENQNLARWVKRQRRQYKLMLTGNKCSTMTQERVDVLNDEGFIWDSHDIVWRERYNQLVEYKAKHGHTRVPSYCKENPQLASWVKCQRRQYKLFWDGKRSSMSAERTQLLENIGFTWEVKKQRSSNDYQRLAQVLSDLH